MRAGIAVAAGLAGLLAGAAQAAIVFETGFEPPFTLGYLNSQQGWNTITGTPARVQPVIAADNPASGAQHLRLALQPNLPANNLKGAFSPVISIPADALVSFSVDVSINMTEGAEYAVALQSTTQGLLTAMVDFSFQDDDLDSVPGDILIREGGSTFTPSGFEFVPGSYRPLRIDYDPLAGTLEYYYDGVLIFDHSVWAGTLIDQIVILSDNFQSAGEFGDFDNIVIDVTPTDECAGTLSGDANCDGRVDNFDIDSWVVGIVNENNPQPPPGYAAGQACWDARQCWGDANNDMSFDNFDIDPFVACIISLPPEGQGCP